MASASNLKHRLVFQQRIAEGDEYGNEEADFAPQFTVAAELIVPRLGSEAVMAARLEGRQPVTIRVRYSSQTAQIQADWRAVDTRNSGIVYALTAPPVDREQRRMWLEIPAVIGGAA